MKQLLMHIILFVFLTALCSCNTKVSKIKNTEITFEKNNYDFHSIASKQYVSATFKFTNTGEEPLLIQNVKSTCGCTVPEYPKEMIRPNDKGEIKVVYDAKLPGRFNKTIIVFYNGKDSPKTLTIKGEVILKKKLE